MEFLVALTILALVLLAAERVVISRKARRRGRFGVPNSLPYSNRKLYFSAAERSFYELLRRMAPDHTVFAKVRMCDVIAVSQGRKAAPPNGIQSKHLDFLICDATLAPVVAIEFDDSSHARADGKARDQFVDAALAAAEVPIVRIPARRSYAVEEIRRLIFPHTRAVGPLC
jgi:hypothetical protein